MAASNPQLRQMLDSNPQARAMMSDPQVGREGGKEGGGVAHELKGAFTRPPSVPSYLPPFQFIQQMTDPNTMRAMMQLQRSGMLSG